MSKKIIPRNNMLTAIKVEYKKNGKEYWSFLCDCGNKVVTDIYSYLSGSSKSCGCFQKK